MIPATLINAVYTLGLQLLALVILDPDSYGAFSIAYLLLALAYSVGLSTISEAWSRALVHRKVDSDWSTYYSASIFLSGLFGLITLVVCTLIPPLNAVAVPVTIAVFFASARSPLRYREVFQLEKRRLYLSDLAGLITLVAVSTFMLWLQLSPLLIITYTWALSAGAAFGLSKHSVLRKPSEVWSWFRSNLDEIRPLLRDSLMLDAGAIGAPYLMVPLLGLSEFGIYRAVSSVAAPIRILIMPLRPMLAKPPHQRLQSNLFFIIMTLVSVTVGAGAWLGLEMVGKFDINLGALSYLPAFAVPTAIFVSANTIGTVYMIVSRIVLYQNTLLVGRIIHTGISIVLPLLGVIAYGLAGAIWGYAFSTLLWALVWIFLTKRLGNQRRLN